MINIHSGEVYYLKDNTGAETPTPILIVRGQLPWDARVQAAIGTTNAVDTKYLFKVVNSLDKKTYFFKLHHIIYIAQDMLGHKIGTLTYAELDELMSDLRFIFDPNYQKITPCPDIFRGSGLGGQVVIPISSDDFGGVINNPGGYTPVNNFGPYAQTISGNPDTLTVTSNNPTTPFRPNTGRYNNKFAPKNNGGYTKSFNANRRTPNKRTDYPASTFSKEDLEKFCSGFRISRDFYDPKYQKKKNVFTADQLKSMMNYDYMDDATKTSAATYAVNKYDSLTPYDAQLIVPHVPTKILSTMLKESLANTRALKVLCDKITKMDMNEYKKSATLSNIVTDSTTIVTRGPMKHEQPNVFDPTEFAKTNRRYINIEGAKKCPKSVAVQFMQCPRHILKMAFSGKSSDFDKWFTTIQEIAAKQ